MQAVQNTAKIGIFLPLTSRYFDILQVSHTFILEPAALQNDVNQIPLTNGGILLYVPFFVALIYSCLLLSSLPYPLALRRGCYTPPH